MNAIFFWICALLNINIFAQSSGMQKTCKSLSEVTKCKTYCVYFVYLIYMFVFCILSAVLNRQHQRKFME